MTTRRKSKYDSLIAIPHPGHRVVVGGYRILWYIDPTLHQYLVLFIGVVRTVQGILVVDFVGREWDDWRLILLCHPLLPRRLGRRPRLMSRRLPTTRLYLIDLVGVCVEERIELSVRIEYGLYASRSIAPIVFVAGANRRRFRRTTAYRRRRCSGLGNDRDSCSIERVWKERIVWK